VSLDQQTSDVRHRRRRQIGIALLVAVLAPSILSLLFLLPSHKPSPHGLPVAIAGSGPPESTLAQRLGKEGFDVTPVGGEQAARRRILRRDAYGAYVFTSGKPGVTLVASAASYQAAQLIQKTGMSAGFRRTEDLKPLDPDDPNGTSIYQLVLPLVFTATFLALAGVGMLQHVGPLPRIALAFAGAVVAGLTIVLVGHAVVGVLPGPWLAEAGVLALAVLAMALAAGGAVRIIGFRALGLAFLFFTALGNPGSGLQTAPELLPPPWHPLGLYLPPGAAGDALKGVAYFNGNGSAGPLLILSGWVLAGALLLAFANRRDESGGAPTELSI
jgi:hypothetical protein